MLSVRLHLRSTLLLASVATGALVPAVASAASHVIPGTGRPVAGDRFEEEDWQYTHNNPKSSKEQDGRTRMPGGRSSNNRWFESNLRGHPDVIKRVETPEGGIKGSEGAMLLRSLRSGIPGRLSGESMQDDLIMNSRSQLSRNYPTSWNPSAVVRVLLPPFEEWEHKNGASFGFRTEVVGTRTEPSGGFFGGTKQETEISWPGIFLCLEPKRGDREARGHIIIRGRENGDYRVINIEETGWWTLGMSFSPDGRCHYYASPGVDKLTREDRIASHFPYNYRCQRLNSIFFNTFNIDNGRSASTPWVIDDPLICVPENIAKRMDAKIQARKNSRSSSR